jgi:hypothetical protein
MSIRKVMLARRHHSFSMKSMHVVCRRQLSVCSLETVSTSFEKNLVRHVALFLEKLGLIFPRCRSKRKYGCVGFDYNTMIEPNEHADDDEFIDEIDLKTGHGHEILSEQDRTSVEQLNQSKVRVIGLTWFLSNMFDRSIV